MNIKTLKGKILLGFAVMILILAGVVGWSIYNFESLSNAINDILVENYRSIKASDSMVESIERQDSALLLLLRTSEEQGQEIFRRNEKEFYTWLARAEDNITIEGEGAILEKINEKYFSFVSNFDQFYNAEEDQRWEIYNQQLLPRFNEIKNDIRELREINRQAMVEAQRSANSRANQAIIYTIVLALLVIAFSLIFAFYLTKQILRPIKELEKGIKKVADRNFQQQIEVASEDEIGVLADEFNEMIAKLQEYEKLNVKKLLMEKEKSEAVVNNLSSPLIVTDQDHKIVLINETAKELFSIKQDVINTHFLEVIQAEEIFEYIKNPDAKEKKTFKLKKDDKERHYRISTRQVIDEDEEYQFTVTLLEDITRLKEIDSMKSEFVSTVSHEFRTPLTSMNMGLSMVINEDTGELNEEQRELLEAAYEDVERLTELVNDLLDLSKIESGRIEMEFDKVDVNDIIEKTLNPFYKQAEEKEIDLKFKQSEDNIFAYADPSKISWVISNLVGNALRYADKGKIEVDAEIKGRRVLVSVADNGPGIPREYQSKIFDKFVRAGNDKDEKSGTGLGLAISKEIITAHNGRIWVDSEEGAGSTFSFYIPRFGYQEGKDE
ncbi:MAG: multi-sensor signal transduction histidine kinase [Halanaerobium sp. 4-GBenrich]|jgi:signal transduction histidine kinase|uniref:histidine kinase n=1 Tax=Halanaerobium congolense TaxID=54121 RepID=A0A1G6NYK6_9FIRM|nr:ATP-binding protein [Halanaerobium congolense]ODS50895.1 MAG: multi-sensor signal transduction histidine kinase [Halanaerobium sp. 4-GBenrich]PUU90872.1 MAG: multi-sensor signal transduction histidine kinase [Halanaerobium sp.]PTX17803.1 signal transduction histidine kinase [Halanaerobium congolense]TDS26334.1 signal transduction histidine kinase [Halanaerobium congolense]TDX43713.1 signal transduction histidine kinase [Halanaerobium congolense]